MDLLTLLTLRVIEMGAWFYFAAFAVSFFESLAVIGLFIPGTALIIFVGFLGAFGLFEIIPMLLFIWAGAILGDLVSFHLGTKGTKFFRQENRWLRASHLGRAERFFNAHGGKSVFLARFIGPIRSVMPFVAGLSKMNARDFLLWNVVGGAVFAAGFFYIGFFFGEMWGSVRLWLHRAEWIALAAAAAFILLYYFSENFSFGAGKPGARE